MVFPADAQPTRDDSPETRDQTWTFVGHWENSCLVLEYVLPGDQQDFRVDNGHWEEGLFAGSGSGATPEVAWAQVREHYESQERGEHYDSADDADAGGDDGRSCEASDLAATLNKDERDAIADALAEASVRVRALAGDDGAVGAGPGQGPDAELVAKLRGVAMPDRWQLTARQVEALARELAPYIAGREHTAWESGHTAGLNNFTVPEGGDFESNPFPAPSEGSGQ